MAKAFDTTLKHLLERFPADWLRLAGMDPRGPIEIVDADLSMVSREADKVFRLVKPHPQIVQMEVQASYDAQLPGRALLYNVLLGHRTGEPVWTVVLLLRPDADGPAMTGRVARHSPHGRPCLEFEYHVLRVWELTVDEILAGGPGVWALAPLAGDANRDNVSRVVRAVERKAERELAKAQSEPLWISTFLLMGMKYPSDLSHAIMKRIRHMKESTTYQSILEEGRREGLEVAHRLTLDRETGILLDIGIELLGEPSATIRRKLERLDDLDRIGRLIRRAHSVKTWTELFREA